MSEPPLKVGITPSEELVELAQSARGLLERILRTEGAPDALQRARDLVEQASAALEPHAATGNQPRFTSDAEPSDARPYYFPANHESPVHTSMPWMDVTQQGAHWRGRVRFDLVHEGPPACVHGGFIAYFFDNMLGQLMVGNQIFGPTRQLQVEYLKPTPVLRPLDFELELGGREGRRALAQASLWDGETKTAQADAIFLPPLAAPTTPNQQT